MNKKCIKCGGNKGIILARGMCMRCTPPKLRRWPAKKKLKLRPAKMKLKPRCEAKLS